LLAGAGMFVRTLNNARSQEPVQDAQKLLLVTLSPAVNRYPAARGQQFYDEVLSRVRAVPGVRGAALVGVVPFTGRSAAAELLVPGQNKLQADFNVISPEFFQTTGLALQRGREFTQQDRADAPQVAIVNQTLAARLWPGEDPLGKQFALANPARTVSVVGVARDGKFRGYRDILRPGFYVPLAQQHRGEMSLEVRTAGPAPAFESTVRREIQALDTSMPLTGILTTEARLDEVLSQERLIATFASGLGLLALALSAIGIYGVLSFAVSRRTREIGIRMALGARPFEVSRMILAESAALTGCGFLIGAAAAILLARLANALLYGVTPADPAAFGLAFVILGTVAIASALLPALRAARLDPAMTLRGE
jgi:predicted permease